MASHFHWKTVNSRPLTIPSGIVHALFPTTFLETAVYNSIKLVFVLNNFPVNNLLLKANWQDFYEKKKKVVPWSKRGTCGKFVCYIWGIGKAKSSPGGGYPTNIWV